MILGAIAISTAVAGQREQTSTNTALKRECDRYGLKYCRVLGEYSGSEFDVREQKRGWWDYLIVAVAVAIFVALAKIAAPPAIAMDLRWVSALGVLLALTLAGCCWALYRKTRFS